MSTFTGAVLRLRLAGSSHGPSVDMTLEGLPAGEKIDLEKLEAFLERRRPGSSLYVTQRKESDRPVFSDGLQDGVLTGRPLVASVENRDVRREDYESFSSVPRPGHADYPAKVRFGKELDLSGGGPFSGRMTLPLCIAGGVCLQLLEKKGIRVFSRLASVGEVEDEGELTGSVSEKPFPAVSSARGERMRERIRKALEDGDSVGGIVEVAVSGLPVGIGGPLFDGLESRMSQLLFGIPAVKGVEFGDGFKAALRSGSENNDAFVIRNGRIETETNHCGGILGGMTDGMMLKLRVAFKPTPSIARKQKSVDLSTGRETTIEIRGRHDPCVALRALPAAEAACAIALTDAAFEMEKSGNTLADCRREIDRLDARILELFVSRMRVSEKIAERKKEEGRPVLDAKREKETLEAIAENSPVELRDYTERLFSCLHELSRDYQTSLLSEGKRPEEDG
ncbi:MAG: chorismate synthase [Clostridia bacterium]|nr:chorismate synthase [Clostridia bacterium]